MSQKKISFEDVDFNITNFTRDGNGQLQAEMTLDVPKVGEVKLEYTFEENPFDEFTSTEIDASVTKDFGVADLTVSIGGQVVSQEEYTNISLTANAELVANVDYFDHDIIENNLSLSIAKVEVDASILTDHLEEGVLDSLIVTGQVSFIDDTFVFDQTIIDNNTIETPSLDFTQTEAARAGAMISDQYKNSKFNGSCPEWLDQQDTTISISLDDVDILDELQNMGVSKVTFENSDIVRTITHQSFLSDLAEEYGTTISKILEDNPNLTAFHNKDGYALISKREIIVGEDEFGNTIAYDNYTGETIVSASGEEDVSPTPNQPSIDYTYNEDNETLTATLTTDTTLDAIASGTGFSADQIASYNGIEDPTATLSAGTSVDMPSEVNQIDENTIEYKGYNGEVQYDVNDNGVIKSIKVDSYGNVIRSDFTSLDDLGSMLNAANIANEYIGGLISDPYGYLVNVDDFIISDAFLDTRLQTLGISQEEFMANNLDINISSGYVSANPDINIDFGYGPLRDINEFENSFSVNPIGTVGYVDTNSIPNYNISVNSLLSGNYTLEQAMNDFANYVATDYVYVSALLDQLEQMEKMSDFYKAVNSTIDRYGNPIYGGRSYDELTTEEKSEYLQETQSLALLAGDQKSARILSYAREAIDPSNNTTPEENWENLKSFASDTYDSISSTVGDVVDGLSDAVGAVGDALGDLGDAIGDALGDLGDAIGDALSGIGDALGFGGDDDDDSFGNDATDADFDDDDEDDDCNMDPLALDLNGNGAIDLTYYDTSTTYFDMDNSGTNERTQWVTRGDGFLAYDKNSDGKIDNIDELFGNQFKSGFTELQELFDSNNDFVIDENDERFGELLVWVDSDLDGISQSTELQSLNDLNITSLNLRNERVNGEERVLEVSSFTMDGEEFLSADVNLLVDYNDNNLGRYQNENGEFQISFESLLLPSLKGEGKVVDSLLLYDREEELKELAQLMTHGSSEAYDNFEDFVRQWSGFDKMLYENGIEKESLNLEDKAWIIEQFYGSDTTQPLITQSYMDQDSSLIEDIEFNESELNSQYSAILQKQFAAFAIQSVYQNAFDGAYFSLVSNSLVIEDEEILYQSLAEYYSQDGIQSIDVALLGNVIQQLDLDTQSILSHIQDPQTQNLVADFFNGNIALNIFNTNPEADVSINGGDSTLTLNNNDDSVVINNSDGATIYTESGDDSIEVNTGDITIDTGTGDDTLILHDGDTIEWEKTFKINTSPFFWYQNKVTKKNTLQGTKSPKGSLKNLNTQKRLRNSLRLNSPRLLSFEYLSFLALCNARDGYGSAEALCFDIGLKEVA